MACKIIIQGTTPTHTFTLPYDTSTLKRVRFVYSQQGQVKVIKDSTDTESPVVLKERTASATLTQEQTFGLTPNVVVHLILRILTEDCKALESEQPVLLMCQGSADKEVLI